MTPEQESRLENIENILAALVKSDRYIIAKTMEFQDGRKIQVGKGTGTMIATETTQKLGFFGKTPVVQPTAPVTLANVISLLQSLGLSA